jgi:hypothetical protein
MGYPDGQIIRTGDLVTIDGTHSGTVVGCVEEGAYLPPHTADQWGYLGTGVLIDTSFGGVVHYLDEESLAFEPVVLLKRVV